MSMHPAINYFKEYKSGCNIFIETGTYKGNGMNLAWEAGFTNIHSIDIIRHPDIAYKYPGVGDVRCYIDNSPTVLSWLLPTINERCMFWLDAHSMLIEDEPDNFPLLDELNEISKHHIKNHVILVDDFLMMTHPDVTGWSKDIIEMCIKDINQNYMIKYLSNPIRKNILLAYDGSL